MVNMMESSLSESMVNTTNNIYDPMVSTPVVDVTL